MFCTQCGSDNSEKAVYCRKCGVALEKEEETRVATRGREDGSSPFEKVEPAVSKRSRGFADGDDEAEIFSISPTLLFVKIGYVAAAVAAILLVGLIATFDLMGSGWAVAAGLLLFLVPGFYHIKRKLIRYTLTESKLEIDEGLISRRTKNLPIRRIQDVTVSMSVIQRVLGFGDLVVDNASDDGEKVTLRNINKPRHYADSLLRQMKRLER
jgi:membrane protein YdbS with pleckstrin-like domain